MGLTKIESIMNWSSYGARISLSLEETKQDQQNGTQKDFVENKWPRNWLLCCGMHSRLLPIQIFDTNLLGIYSQLHRLHWTMKFLCSSKSPVSKPKHNLHLKNSTNALHSCHSQFHTLHTTCLFIRPYIPANFIILAINKSVELSAPFDTFYKGFIHSATTKISRDNAERSADFVWTCPLVNNLLTSLYFFQTSDIWKVAIGIA